MPFGVIVSTMEDNQIIIKLKTLKNITPRKEWVVLSKQEIFSNTPIAPVISDFPGNGFLANVSAMFMQKKFAYALVAVLVVAAGTFGAIKFLPQNGNLSPEQSAAVLVEAKSNVETFKVKSQNLAGARKEDQKSFSVAVDDVKAAAKQLTEIIKKDPEVAKEVALEVNNNKTFLDEVGGNNLNEVSDMYAAIVNQMTKDSSNTTLTEAEKIEWDRIKASLKKGGDYTTATALRDILLISRTAKRD